MQVELAFTGICAFVEIKKGVFAAIMPNARKEYDHVPWMRVTQGKKLTAQYALTTEELWLEGGISGPLEPQDPGPHKEPPSKNNRRSSNWIIPFEKACQCVPKLKPEYLKPSSKGAASVISVFFRLPAGSLEVSCVHDEIWRFRSDNNKVPSLSQSCAQEVSVMTEIQNSDRVTIGGSDLRTQQSTTRVIALRREGKLRILIGNTMPSPEDPMGSYQTKDEHFRIYYEMISNNISPRDQRIPYKSKTILSASGLNCPPTRIPYP
jgi:hypothetical protein